MILTDTSGRRSIRRPLVRHHRGDHEIPAPAVGDAAAEAALGPEGRETMVEDHRRFSSTLRDRGAMVLGEALVSRDAAIELAKQVPRSPGLVVELSPIAGT